jgi:sugar/nucleoside kinase (ribokinase family)
LVNRFSKALDNPAASDYISQSIEDRSESYSSFFPAPNEIPATRHVEASEQISARDFDVSVVCDTCVDLVLTGNVRPQFHQVEQIVDDCSLQLGGSSTIFGSQMAKLGNRVQAIGWIGPDLFGNFVLENLRQAGVDTTTLRPHKTLKTGVGVALSERNDRAILTYMGTIDATQPADLDHKLLINCRHWHISSYFLLGSLRQFWPGWLTKCRQEGVSTSMDTNWDPADQWNGVLSLLPLLDLLFVNDAEARRLTSETDLDRACKRLAADGPLVVVKRGELGALAVKGDSMWQLTPSLETGLPEQVVDATGAGDNFDAGFLSAYLAGKDIHACLTLGHRCAVSSLGYLGAVQGQLWKHHIDAHQRKENNLAAL